MSNVVHVYVADNSSQLRCENHLIPFADPYIKISLIVDWIEKKELLDQASSGPIWPPDSLVQDESNAMSVITNAISESQFKKRDN